jgi:hypothetical protein
MAPTDWKSIAQVLYEALMQMRKSRGIIQDDLDLMDEAFSLYEKNAFFNPNVMMWRVKYHRNDTGFYQTGCFQCDVTEMRLEDLESARKWCKEHQCQKGQ